MSNITPVAPREFTDREIALIKETVAKGATAEEFKLFIYRCLHMGLDPLKPGQIYFVKYNNNPGTIIVGREGFRSRAARTGKHAGTKLGVLRDDKGKCIGAWCEVYRSDWEHPAREEVSLAEYNTGKNQWAKMPETMIKKVAEAAALRMAFPDELGGLYVREEMDQALEGQGRDVNQRSGPSTPPPPQAPEPASTSTPLERFKFLSEYRVPINFVHGGSRLSDLGVPDIEASIQYWQKRAEASASGSLTGKPLEFVENATEYLKLKNELGANPSILPDSDEWTDGDFDTAFDLARDVK